MRPTWEGKRFLLATFLIGIASFNTGNNLIYLIFAMMLSILVLAFVLSRANLKGLRAEVVPREHTYAGIPVYLTFELINEKRRMDSYSIKVHSPDGLEGQEGFVSHMPPGHKERVSLNITFPRRGVYTFDTLEIETEFPFIFFTAKRRISTKGEVVVYPKIIDVSVSAILEGGHGGALAGRPGLGDELLMIRGFQAGDDIKQIHWKASAKSGALMVKQHAEEAPMRATVVLDNMGVTGGELFEKAVTYAASACSAFLDDGYYVRLATCSTIVSYGIGVEQHHKIMEALAFVKEVDARQCPAGHESDGFTILVLKNGSSPLLNDYPDASMVVYAVDL